MTVTISLAPDTEAKLASAQTDQNNQHGSMAQASSNQRVIAWDKWVSQLRDWGEKNLPANHVVDDSRESIYEGLGE